MASRRGTRQAAGVSAHADTKTKRCSCFLVDNLSAWNSSCNVSSLLHSVFSVEKFMQNSMIIINVKNVWGNSLLKYSLEIVHNTDFK